MPPDVEQFLGSTWEHLEQVKTHLQFERKNQSALIKFLKDTAKSLFKQSQMFQAQLENIGEKLKHLERENTELKAFIILI